MYKRHDVLPNALNSLKAFAVAIALFPGILIHDAGLLYSRFMDSRRRSKSYRRDWKRDALPPLKLKRRRALSFLQISTDSSLHYPLLARLPKEIRLQIWQYAMGSGGYHYHLRYGRGKLSHIVCQSGGHNNLTDRCDLCCPSMASRSCCPEILDHPVTTWSGDPVGHMLTVPNAGTSSTHTRKRADLTLLRTCRQIYQEAVELPYSTNIFDVDDLSTLVYWSRSITPNRLAAVKSLRINWEVLWPPLQETNPTGSLAFQYTWLYEQVCLKHSDETWLEFWDTVALTMTGLQDLRVKIDFMFKDYSFTDLKTFFGIDRGLPRIINAPWLQPVLRIRGLLRFELEIDDGTDWRGPGLRTVRSEVPQPELKEMTEKLLEDIRCIVYKPSLP